MPAAEIYAPRLFVSLGLWTVGDLRLKPYVIHLAEADPPGPDVLAAARMVVDRTMPTAAAEEGAAVGPGFIVLHAGLAGTWLLMDWWAHGDICCQRLARADPGTAAFRPMDHRPLMACVWELAVIQHERDAWIRHMMTASPDGEAYLADRLPSGLY